MAYIQSNSPILPSGGAVFIRSPAALEVNSRAVLVWFVSIKAGDMEFTRMLLEPSSPANAFATIRTPPLPEAL